MEKGEKFDIQPYNLRSVRYNPYVLDYPCSYLGYI